MPNSFLKSITSECFLLKLSPRANRSSFFIVNFICLKGGKNDALDSLIGGRESGYLIPRVDLRSISRAFARDAKRAGIGGKLHWLRHTFVSHLVMSGMTLRKVQILAGHANYSTTEKYAHLSPEHLQGLGGVEI